jgi:uncharacterized protein (DUF1499 family)
MQFLFRRVLPIVLLMVTVWMTITPAEAAMFKFSGQRPNNLGVQNGRLQSCPNTPNCVSSEATDSEHQIADLKYLGDDTIATIKAIVLAQPGAAVISETGDYLYAEFTSKLMGFVDDVEFYVDRNAQTVKVRSASRLGQSDLGVNRKRIETIRSLM